MKTKIAFSFKGRNQLPLFMVIKEYYDDNGDIEFAEILFQINGRKMRKLDKKLGIPSKCWSKCWKYGLAMLFIKNQYRIPNCCVGCKWAKNNKCTRGLTK